MENDNNHFGKIFLHLSWIILLIGLGLFFHHYLEQKNNPNQNPFSQYEGGFTEVKLQRNSQNHYIASGSINGQTVVFLVDTGATHVAIGNKLAQKLGLLRGREGIAYTANGTTPTFDTQLNSLRLGDITLNDVSASITLGMEGDEVLLGMSALKHLELIHRNGELTLRQLRR
jgi:aspartyl protease family protein